MKRKNQPVRLHKQEAKRPLIDEDNMIFGIPIEFLLITIILGTGFILILLFMGPCTDSGLMYNHLLD